MTTGDVTAVLVTRGDVDILPILESCKSAGFRETLVCDNAFRAASGFPDMGPLGQFQLALEYEGGTFYFQDDDVLVSAPGAVVAAWRPGIIVCNMSEAYRANYRDQPDKLMGFGSVLNWALIRQTFQRYFAAGFKADRVLWREPGRLHTCLNPVELVDVPIEHLPWATAPNRLYRQPDHLHLAGLMRERAALILEKEKKAA